jgi:hypothetical protein
MLRIVLQCSTEYIINTVIKPATKNNEVSEQLQLLLSSTSTWIDKSGIAFKAIEKNIRELMKADAASGSIRMADLFSFAGDMEMVEYWIQNALRLNTPKVSCRLTEMIASGNLGYFTRAATAYESAVAMKFGNLSNDFSMGLICGAFDAMLNNIEAKRLGSLDWGVDNDRAAKLALRAKEALDRLGLRDEDVQSMLDVAGEVLREERQIWMGPGPVIRVINTESDIGILYQFHVGGDPEWACQLTERVIDRLIEREIDCHGISFSFLPWPIELAS